jgi:hypothetical protein
MVPPRTRGETFAHAQLMAQAEALREAKPSSSVRSEADRPAQRGGSPALGEAEKIRDI